MYLESQTFYFEFSTYNSATGALANADSTPTGVLVANGVDQGATVTITNVATGVYKGSVPLVTLNVMGTEFYVRVTATVNSVTAKQSTPPQKMSMIGGDGQSGLNAIGLGYYNNEEIPGVREAVGMAAADLDTQLAAIAAGGGGATVYTAVTYSGPVPDDESLPITLYKGRKATIGPLTFTDYDGAITHGSSVTLRILPKDTYEDTSEPSIVALVESVATASLVDGTLTLTWELMASDTNALPAGADGSGRTVYKMIAGSTTGDEYPVVDRECVVKRYPAAPV